MQRVRQTPGLGLVGHGVDLELERLAGTLAGTHRVTHVTRLVVRDGHALRIEAGQGRGNGIGELPLTFPGRTARHLRR